MGKQPSKSQPESRSVRKPFKSALWMLSLVLVGAGTIFVLTSYDDWSHKRLRSVLDTIKPDAYPESLPGANASSDTNLWSLHLPEGAETLRVALAQVPAGEAIAFVGNATNPYYNLIEQMVAYVSWPRPILRVECWPRNRELKSYSVGPGTRFGAILFFGPPTPGAPIRSTYAIAPNLTLATIESGEQWISYCPPSGS